MTRSRDWLLISLVAGLTLMFSVRAADSQVVVNELIKDQRSTGGGSVVDDREFIELYNAGNSSVDISNWTLGFFSLDSGSELFSVPIDPGTTLAAGDYFVLGNAAGVPNVDQDSGAADLFPDDNWGYELRDASANLIDALATDLYRDPQLDLMTAELLAETGGGWWGGALSTNAPVPQSLGRYLDGRDTNRNGYDFGYVPSTPGTSNNLPQVGAHTIVDVDAMSVGSDVPGYNYSFVGPKVVDPTVASSFVPHAISASPQGGNAITAWDSTGGGNMVASDSLVTSFDLYAYLDTDPLNVSTGGQEWESTIYGIGSTDAFFFNPDPTELFVTDPETANGSTGIGWLYQREELSGFESLMLVDMNDGGDSFATAADWTVIQTIDLTSEPSGWHRLGIDFDSNTGQVVATYDSQTFMFTTSTDLLGTFYVGYREGLSGGVPSTAGPPIFDLVALTPADDADFDGDGDIDGNDLLIWQRGIGIGTLQTEGDADHDGDVDGDDLAIWQNQYGTSPLSTITTPEPATGILLGGLVCLLAVRRVRK